MNCKEKQRNGVGLLRKISIRKNSPFEELQSTIKEYEGRWQRYLNLNLKSPLKTESK